MEKFAIYLFFKFIYYLNVLDFMTKQEARRVAGNKKGLLFHCKTIFKFSYFIIKWCLILIAFFLMFIFNDDIYFNLASQHLVLKSIN